MNGSNCAEYDMTINLFSFIGHQLCLRAEKIEIQAPPRMDVSSQETVMKKKLQTFLVEMLKFGTVKGFKHFVMYMRGREEMVISVVNEPHGPSNSDHQSSVPNQRKFSISESFSSNNLPYDKRSLMLSTRSQLVLSTHGVKDVGLPPASPSEGESMMVDEHSTLFLIAGYTRYTCPYVWVRSNHDRLVKLTGDSSREKDAPLRLKSTLRWKESDVYVWDIVAELVKLCTYPAPRNPFAIDFEYFSQLSSQEKVLATAAMVSCLQKILIHTPAEKPYAGQVFEELQLITKQHYQALGRLIQEQGLPVLKTQQGPPSAISRQSSQSRSRHSSYTSQPRSRTSSYNAPQPVNQPYNYGYGAPAMY